MSRVIVKPACPAANEIAWGAYAASRTAAGSSTHSSTSFIPTARTSPTPTNRPTAVPRRALSTLASVPSAFERSTESVPSTIQNECWRLDCCAIRTATASAAAPLTLLRSWTARRLPYPRATVRDASRADFALAAPSCRGSSPAARTAFAPISRAATASSRTRNDAPPHRPSTGRPLRAVRQRCRLPAPQQRDPGRHRAGPARASLRPRPASRRSQSASTPRPRAAPGFVPRSRGRVPARRCGRGRSSGTSRVGLPGTPAPRSSRLLRWAGRESTGRSSARRRRPRARRRHARRRAGDCPSSSAPTSAASERQARSAASRSALRGRGGHNSIAAEIPTPQASAHPSSRSGMAEGAAGRVTGRMNVSSEAGPAMVKYGWSTVEKSTANPTTPIAAGASHSLCEHSVPSAISAAPTAASPR